MKKFLNAFTLLELSVVLVIVVILTTIGFDMGKYFLEQNRVRTTEIKLTKIQNALNAYLIKYGTLPCPTGLKNSDGEALSNCSTTNETNVFMLKMV